MRNEIEIIRNYLESIHREFTKLTRLEIDPSVREHLSEIWESYRHIKAEIDLIHDKLENPFLEPYPQRTSKEKKYIAKNAPRKELQGEGQEQSQPSLIKKSVTAPNENTRIIVVDDDDSTQKIVQFGLKKFKYHVESITDPTLLDDALKSGLPRIIILDLMMPQLDGFQLLKNLRSNPKFNSVYIIIASSRSYEKDRLTVLGMGANEFIAKPYNIKELALRIRNILEHNQQTA